MEGTAKYASLMSVLYYVKIVTSFRTPRVSILYRKKTVLSVLVFGHISVKYMYKLYFKSQISFTVYQSQCVLLKFNEPKNEEDFAALKFYPIFNRVAHYSCYQSHY
jgi:hypothetical protein